ncbi:hypothetical protein BHK98_07680 [Hornefia porci]|uniref:Aminotransferase n=1 Tax=Hornefia porci TaxID=2652292 RepID=A0A1Q9JIJ6_9FIRM|nr:pyridoxal phosphate-dependent aminotransferase [Hornefia porci]OLR55947.1 hypothetical protein BHK98_07680 [Hornefia porci]
MKDFSQRALNVPPSEIRRMFAMQEGMEDVVSFALGEPDFDVPDHVVRAIIDSYERRETHYTPNRGLKPLRSAIASEYRRRGLNYSEDEILITPGAVGALNLISLLLMREGDEVILPDPCWSNYIGLVAQTGADAVPVKVRAENRFMFDLDELAAAVTDRTKAILINSPSNPTGGVLDRATIEGIAALAMERDLYVISDEIYRELLWDGTKYTSIASVPGMKERTLLVDGFSKTFAMTGIRLGYLAAPEHMIDRMNTLLENVFSCINEPIQWGGVAALENGREDVERMKAVYRKRRRHIVDGLNAIDGISCADPAGAFYVFPDISRSGLSSADFAMCLLQEEHVVTIPGSGFGAGGEGFVRLSYAVDTETIDEGLRRIRRFMENRTGRR